MRMIGEPLIFRLEGAGHSEMGDNSMGYRATNVSAERDGPRRGLDVCYLTALLISSQNAPTAAPAAPPTAAPRSGLPPTTVPTTAPPAAPIAPPLKARCCWDVIFAHPATAQSMKTSRSASTLFI
jgi:hypothetical protein